MVWNNFFVRTNAVLGRNDKLRYIIHNCIEFNHKLFQLYKLNTFIEDVLNGFYPKIARLAYECAIGRLIVSLTSYELRYI